MTKLEKVVHKGKTSEGIEEQQARSGKSQKNWDPFRLKVGKMIPHAQ